MSQNRVKIEKLMPLACVQPTGHISFSIFLIFGRCNGMVYVLPPYLFGSFRLKIESEMSQNRLCFSIMPFAFVFPTGHITCGIFLKFDRHINVVLMLPSYCFGSLRVKNESLMTQNDSKFSKLRCLLLV